MPLHSEHIVPTSLEGEAKAVSSFAAGACAVDDGGAICLAVAGEAFYDMLMCESILREFLSDILEARQLSSRKPVGATAVHLKLAVIPATVISRQFSDGLARGVLRARRTAADIAVSLAASDGLTRGPLPARRTIANLGANLVVKAVCA